MGRWEPVGTCSCPDCTGSRPAEPDDHDVYTEVIVADTTEQANRLFQIKIAERLGMEPDELVSLEVTLVTGDAESQVNVIAVLPTTDVIDLYHEAVADLRREREGA